MPPLLYNENMQVTKCEIKKIYMVNTFTCEIMSDPNARVEMAVVNNVEKIIGVNTKLGSVRHCDTQVTNWGKLTYCHYDQGQVMLITDNPTEAFIYAERIRHSQVRGMSHSIYLCNKKYKDNNIPQNTFRSLAEECFASENHKCALYLLEQRSFGGAPHMVEMNVTAKEMELSVEGGCKVSFKRYSYPYEEFTVDGNSTVAIGSNYTIFTHPIDAVKGLEEKIAERKRELTEIMKRNVETTS